MVIERGYVEEKYAKRKKEKEPSISDQTARCLRECDLNLLAVGAHGATTAGTLHDGVVAAATTVAGFAVEEVIFSALLAGESIVVLALEDASLHVRFALGTLGGNAGTLHVNIAGDIESTSLAKGDFKPGLIAATEEGELAAVEHGSAGSRHVLREGESDTLTSLEAD